jgi:hypothetical protein
MTMNASTSTRGRPLVPTTTTTTLTVLVTVDDQVFAQTTERYRVAARKSTVFTKAPLT